MNRAVLAELRQRFVDAIEAQEHAAQLTTLAVLEMERLWPAMKGRALETDAVVGTHAALIRIRKIIESFDRYAEILAYQESLGLERSP